MDLQAFDIFLVEMPISGSIALDYFHKNSEYISIVIQLPSSAI